MKLNDYPERDDVLPRGWAPIKVRRHIAKTGGLNPYGEKQYRIVLAQSIMEWHGGRYHDWPASSSLEEQGGQVFDEGQALEMEKFIVKIKAAKGSIPEQEIFSEMKRLVPSALQPLRVVEEMRFVQRYPYHEGWMLQCWRPPEQFGSKTWWESQTVPGRSDLPILGPFPSQGAYEALDHLEMGENGVTINRTTYRELPTMGQIEHAIQCLEDHKYRELEAATPEARHLIRVHDYEQRVIAEGRRASQERQAQIRDVLRTYLSSSLAGGKMRTELADQARVSSHVGN